MSDAFLVSLTRMFAGRQVPWGRTFPTVEPVSQTWRAWPKLAMLDRQSRRASFPGAACGAKQKAIQGHG
jgi:hypothetical protein